jgi:hypothetical protein
MSTIAIEHRTTDDKQVIEWRIEALERAGYDEIAAIELALRTDVDLHGAASIVRQGCPVDIALRILL